MRVLIAAASSEALSVLDALVRGDENFSLAAAASSIPQACAKVSQNSIDLAFVDAGLVEAAGFETLATTLIDHRVQWCVLGDRADAARLRDLVSVFGVAVLPRTTPPNALFQSFSNLPQRSATKLKNDPKVGAEEDRIFLIGSSTGGVEALIEVLSGFPADSPPTLLVQHTGGSFSGGLARLLDTRVRPTVVEAVDGAKLERGTIYLAPGDLHHLKLTGRSNPVCKLEEAAPVSGHRPSVDALFSSAVPFASKVTAAILTGMGRDGAQGLLQLRQAGARTLGQDEASSLVYGMPRVAFEIGAVERQLPLRQISKAMFDTLRATA